MKRMAPMVTLFVVLFASFLSAMAQTSSSTEEIERLKSIVGQQQKMLEQQQAEIAVLQSAMAEQKSLLVNMTQGRTSGATPDPAASRHSDNKVQAQDQPLAVAGEQRSLTPAQEQVQEELQRGPEIADVTPTTPALQLGPAKVRLIGYPALTTVWRSTNTVATWRQISITYRTATRCPAQRVSSVYRPRTRDWRFASMPT